MNVFTLHKKFLHLVLAGMLFLCSFQARSQSSGLDIHEIPLLVNDTLTFEFDHYSILAVPFIVKAPVNGRVFFDPRGITSYHGVKPNRIPAKYRIVYIPNPGFIGKETLEISFYKSLGNGLSVQSYKILNILVVPSFLYADDDYATTNTGQEVVVDVLSNDYGNGTYLTIADIPMVNHGTAVKVEGGKKLKFMPAAGFSGVAHLNYTICDLQGACDVATVSVSVNSPSAPAHESYFVTTGKNSPQVLFHDLGINYQVVSPPSNGTLESFDVLTYVPKKDFTGYDRVLLNNQSTGKTREIQIRVLNTPAKNLFLFDDVAYTPVDSRIDQIRLLDNDNSSNLLRNIVVVGYPNTEKGGQLVDLSSVGKGVYKYIPPAGFSGIDKFTYKASLPSGGGWESATCYIVVSNQNPVQPVFRFSTPRNTPFVIGDHLPFTNYQFTNYNNGANLGTLKFYPGLQSVSSQHGQSFSGYNQLVYEPRKDVVGADVFEFNYCAGDQIVNCPLVKVEIEVVDYPQLSGTGACAGSDCVWTGDANNDGAVDVRDILPLGLMMGTVGKTRSNSQLEWYGQYSADWSDYNNNLGYNLKHVDIDGNGIINSSDTVAIRKFYGKYHNLTPEPTGSIKKLPFYIEEPEFTTIQPGDVLYAPIKLGTSSTPAIDAYGLSFGIDYDPALFKSVKVIFNDKSFMSYNAPVLTLTHAPFPGKLEAAYTRTNGKSANGYGVIGAVEFIVIDDIIGGRLNSNQTKIQLYSKGLIDASGTSSSLDGNSLLLKLDLGAASDNAEFADKLVVYPNPASTHVDVHINGSGNLMERVMLFDMLGKVVYDSGKTSFKRTSLDVNDLASGLYTLKAFSNGNVLASKLEVINRD